MKYYCLIYSQSSHGKHRHCHMLTTQSFIHSLTHSYVPWTIKSHETTTWYNEHAALHAAPRSTTQHHAAPRSTTQHHAAPRSTTQPSCCHFFLLFLFFLYILLFRMHASDVCIYGYLSILAFCAVIYGVIVVFYGGIDQQPIRVDGTYLSPLFLPYNFPSSTPLFLLLLPCLMSRFHVLSNRFIYSGSATWRHYQSRNHLLITSAG